MKIHHAAVMVIKCVYDINFFSGCVTISGKSQNKNTAMPDILTLPSMGGNPSPLTDHVIISYISSRLMDISTRASQTLGPKCSHPKSWGKKSIVSAISLGILTQLAVPQTKPPGVNCACLKKPRTNAVAAFQRYKTEASRDKQQRRSILFLKRFHCFHTISRACHLILKEIYKKTKDNHQTSFSQHVCSWNAFMRLKEWRNTTISTPKVVPSAAMMNIEDRANQLEVYYVAKKQVN